MKIAALCCLVTLTGAAVQGGREIRASIQPERERTLAPDFRLKDASGKSVRLSKYRGGVVLLDFWATECGGCKQEIPAFIRMEATYRGKGLSAVGVSVDIMYENLKGPADAWAKVKPFAESVKLNYPVLMGDDAVTKSYDLQSLPLTLLIDKHGRVAARYAGVVDAANLEDNIEALLREY